MRTPFMIPLASAMLLMALSACSPDQNWREVSFDGSPLKAQLPCKPDRTTRNVPLGGAPVALQVVGCESGKAMVAIMTAPLPPGADPNAVMQGWQKITLDNARLTQPLAPEQSTPWPRKGFLPLKAAQRIQAKGLGPDGSPVQVDAVWGAVAEGDHVRLVHAVVYSPVVSVELSNTLFESVKP